MSVYQNLMYEVWIITIRTPEEGEVAATAKHRMVEASSWAHAVDKAVGFSDSPSYLTYFGDGWSMYRSGTRVVLVRKADQVTMEKWRGRGCPMCGKQGETRPALVDKEREAKESYGVYHCKTEACRVSIYEGAAVEATEDDVSS